MKTKIFLPIAMVLFLSFLITACVDNNGGNKKKVTREISLEAFHRIETSACLKIDVVPGEEYTIRLKGGEDKLNKLSVRVEDDKLILITTQQNDLDFPSAVITTPSSIRSITMGGLEDVALNVPVDSSSFSVTITGLGRFLHRDIQTEQVEASVSGVGSVKLKGSAPNVNLHISGCGLINSEELRAKVAECHNSGIGMIRTFASNNLTGEISGIGRLIYTGNPSVLTKNTGLLGSIKMKD